MQAQYYLGPVSEIPVGEGRVFWIEEQPIAVFRLRSGSVYATQAICPHRGGPLADGLIGGTVLACPLHGWKFDLRNGEPLLGTCGITTYPVHLTETGQIVLTYDGSHLPQITGPPDGAADNKGTTIF